MLKVGVTGGIGSGKSLVCRIFRMLGIPVFEADAVARMLINNNETIRENLIHLFGPDIYTNEGAIDRKQLAGQIFNNRNLLLKVNEIVHPQVRNNFIEWAAKLDEPYVVHEAAILFESGFFKMMDFNILVTAPESIRIQRVIERDRLSMEQVVERIGRQWKDDEKAKLADIVIINDDKELIIPQIIEIDRKLRNHGKIW
jgi:dephospho-CoA kinase